MAANSLFVYWSRDNSEAVIYFANSALSDSAAADSIDYAVFSRPSGGQKATLIGWLDRHDRKPDWYAVPIPDGHDELVIRKSVRARNQPDLVVRLGLDKEGASGGIIVTKIVADGKPPEQAIDMLHVPSLIGNRINDLLTQDGGRNLVWAVAHRYEQTSQLHHVSSLERHWPVPPRIEISVLPTSRPPTKVDATVGQPAILQHALEAAIVSNVRLQMRFDAFGRPDSNALEGVTIAQIKHQLRSMRSDPERGDDHGKFVIETALFSTLFAGVPDSELGIVGIDDDIAVTSLPYLMGLAPGQEHQGLKLERRQDDTVVIEFYGVSFGDDIGFVVFPRDGIELVVRPSARMMDPRVVLFRVGHDAQYAHVPKLLDRPEESVVAELVRKVAEVNGMVNGLPVRRAPSDKSVLRAMGLQENAYWESELLSQPLGPLLLSTWSSRRTANGTAGGFEQGEFESFRRNPPLYVFAQSHGLSDRLDNIIESLGREPDSLPQQIAALLGVPDLVAKGAVSQDFAAATMRILSCPIEVDGVRMTLGERLAQVRVQISEPIPSIADAKEISSGLVADGQLKELAGACEDRSRLADANLISGYLESRRAGRWISIKEARKLIEIIKSMEVGPMEIVAEDRNDSRPLPDFPTALASFEHLLARAEKIPEAAAVAAQMRANVARLSIQSKLDRRVLRMLTTDLLQKAGLQPTMENVLDTVVTRIEAWARLPDFAIDIQARLLKGAENRPSRKGSIARQYVNRLGWKPVFRKCDFDDARGKFRSAVVNLIDSSLEGVVVEEGKVEMAREDLSAFGDILYFHRANIEIRRMVEECGEKEGRYIDDIRRLERRLADWPHHAAETWEEARRIDKMLNRTSGLSDLQNLSL